MRLPLLATSFVFSVAASMYAAPAWAAPTYVLEVATDDADDQAKALTNVLKARIKATKDMTLGDADVSLQVVLLQFKCGDVPDVGCQAKIGEKLAAQQYVWGTMRKAPNHQVVADLHYWQKDKPEVRQQFTFSDNLTEPADPALQRLADQMIARLTQFGKLGTAKVAAAQSIAGDLYVDGKPVGTFSNGLAELTLPLGDHRFEVRSGGKVLASANATVSPTTPVDVALRATASGKPEEPIPEGGPTGGWKRPVGYAAVGVGGALILGGVYSMIKVSSVNHDDKFSSYAKGFGPNEDICQRAQSGAISKAPGAGSPSEVKDLCDTGSTFQTLQWVFLGLGVVSTGAGVYLLATAPPKDQPTQGRIVVSPRLGKTETGVELRVGFLAPSMRIVAGRLKGRRLVAPGDEGTRPTSEKVREAVFSALGAIDGHVVLDLFAGTGALALEAISRGAERATLVESRRQALASIRANVAALGVAGAIDVVARPVERAHAALAASGPYSLVFADPPWALVEDGSAGRSLALALAAPVTSEEATLVLEHAARTAPPAIEGFSLSDTRRYGDTAVSFYASANSSPSRTASSIDPGPP